MRKAVHLKLAQRKWLVAGATVVAGAAVFATASTAVEATNNAQNSATTTLVSTDTPSTTVTTPAANPNLAQGTAATATGQESDQFSAAMVVDGDASTRWAGAAGETNGDQTLTIDLGKVQTISELDLSFKSTTTDYEVLTSPDGKNYTPRLTVKDTEVKKAYSLPIVFSATPVRYTQYHQLKNTKPSGSINWYASSIYEIEAYSAKRVLSSLQLDAKQITLTPGENKDLTYTTTPTGLVLNEENSNLQWFSSDDAIVSVANGKLTAMGAGTATVSLTDKVTGLHSETQVTVLSQIESDTTLAMMRERWLNRLMPKAPDLTNPNIRAYLKSVADKSDELWNTMDRSADRTTIWAKVPTASASADMTSTFVNIKALTLGYCDPLSQQYKDPAVYQAIIDALDYMITTKKYNGTYHSDNWWDWNIGSSQPLVDTLMLLYDDLKAKDPTALAKYVKPITLYDAAPDVMFTGGKATGANLTDIALAVLGSGLLVDDTNRIALVQQQMPEVLGFSQTGDGMYADGSFVQHEKHAYNGAYGADMLRGIARIVATLDSTPWAIKDEQLVPYFQYVQKGSVELIVNGRMPSMFSGRSISRGAGLSPDAPELYSGKKSFDGLSMVASIAPVALRNEIYQEIATSIREVGDRFNYFENPRDYGTLVDLQKAVDAGQGQISELPVINILAKINRVVQRTPSYSVGISMYSDKVFTYEYGNGENRHAFHTADGMFYLYNDDLTQFGEGFWPTVDPYRLPGITVDTIPLADGAHAGKTSPEKWVGGSKDNEVAAIGMALNKTNLKQNLIAKKSWFLLNGQIVNLGAGINGSTTADIETILDNRILSTPDTKVTVDGAAFKNGTTVNSWANINTGKTKTNVGYIVAAGNDNVTASEAARTGKYADINPTHGTPKVYTFDYLTLAINHGQKVTNGKYEYVTVPGATDEQIAKLAANPEYQVLANTADVQAIKDGNRMLANVWTKAENLSDLLSVDQPSSLIVKDLGNNDYQINISDPTQSNEKITLKFNHDITASADVDSVFAVKGDLLIFDSTNLNGASRSVTIHVNSPKGEQSVTDKPDTTKPVVTENHESNKLQSGSHQSNRSAVTQTPATQKATKKVLNSDKRKTSLPNTGESMFSAVLAGLIGAVIVGILALQIFNHRKYLS